jgi:SOS-response transcriptional repressor LexA
MSSIDVKNIRIKLGISQERLAEMIGVSLRTVQNYESGRQIPKSKNAILHKLESGIIKEESEDRNVKSAKSGIVETFLHYIRLLPISASGGSLNNFTVAVKDSDCEKIISPIRDADFALTVSGNSMYPEFPAGSQVLVKKIDESQFIEWGRTYVLDTCNGVVIKKLVKGDPEFYHCLSVNPDQAKYAPFDIPVDAVIGVYRVLMIMSMK